MTREAMTLMRIGAVITSSLKIEDTANLVLEQIKCVIPYDVATIFLHCGCYLEVIGENGYSEENPVMDQRISFPQSGSLSTLAIQYREPVICNNIPEEFPSFKHLYKGKKVVSWMGLPLIVRNKVFGLLSFSSFQSNFYSENHYNLAMKFVDNVAVAIDNAILYEQTHKMATQDSLTGLLNRHGFRDPANLLLEQAKRTKRSIALILIDIDHFKQVNDTYGHDVGDVVIKRMGCLLRKSIRSMDIAARYGGEEFLLLSPETSLSEAEIITERLRISVESLDFKEMKKGITVSCGLFVAVPQCEDSVESMIKEADKLLYEAKGKGRNCVISNSHH